LDVNIISTFGISYRGGDQVGINIRNLLDSDSIYINSALNYSSCVTNPFGQVIRVTLKVKFWGAPWINRFGIAEML
jgi:hypothetical protein